MRSPRPSVGRDQNRRHSHHPSMTLSLPRPPDRSARASPKTGLISSNRLGPYRLDRRRCRGSRHGIRRERDGGHPEGSTECGTSGLYDGRRSSPRSSGRMVRGSGRWQPSGRDPSVAQLAADPFTFFSCKDRWRPARTSAAMVPEGGAAVHPHVEVDAGRRGTRGRHRQMTAVTAETRVAGIRYAGRQRRCDRGSSSSRLASSSSSTSSWVSSTSRRGVGGR